MTSSGEAHPSRTRHRNADGTPKYTNRLVRESSPYLLQHAHNPVDWFSWGDEAFERAIALGRPIFLSIGYSTCHWCHVMEEESFEDEEIARALNEHFVAIKVDREERPDVDQVYMSFVQAFTGSGGWPMSVWLTPNRDPFFGGTYFPPRAKTRQMRHGFLDVLSAIADEFQHNRDGIVASASEIAKRLKTAHAPEPAGEPPATSTLRVARDEARQRFDPVFGGARGAPKFPASFPIGMLLRFARREKDDEAQNMATATLRGMRAGGIWDHVGGGFHRYSTDAMWLVPHFEKMLYDNALLARAYLDGFQATSDSSFASTARDTLDYVLREMTASDGTFYAATDADSLAPNGHREEGYFFTWTPDEMVATLGQDDARIAQSWFGVTQRGNYEGRNVLATQRSIDEVARELEMPAFDLGRRLSAIRERLFLARSTRPPPPRDDKVIVAWNALAISAFARAAIVFHDTRYAEAALRAANVLVAPFASSKKLPHMFVDGHARGLGFADDCLCLGEALIDLFELTSDCAWLASAVDLMDEVERAFLDRENGGYFATSDAHERLLLRQKPDVDGPVPSANGVAARVLLRLHAFTDDVRFFERAQRTLRASSRALEVRPLSLESMLHALDWMVDSPKQIAIVVPEGRGALCTSARPFFDVLRRVFVPNAVIVTATALDLDGELGRLVPWAKGKSAVEGKATAYVCERGACKRPTNAPDVFAGELA